MGFRVQSRCCGALGISNYEAMFLEAEDGIMQNDIGVELTKVCLE